MTPTVAAPPPAGWRAAEVPRPKLADGAGAELVDWRATSPHGAPGTADGALVSGCVATPIPGWVEDMRPAVEARAVALGGAVGERITGSPMDARSVDDAFVLRLASDLDGPPAGALRVFVGFDDDGRVLTCFAACARDGRSSSGADAGAPEVGCEGAVRAARLVGATAPPAAGLGLRGVTWGVHHPGDAAIAGAALVLAAGVLAVVIRRRPRFHG